MNAPLLLRDTIFRVIDVEGTDRDPNLTRVCEVAYRDIDFNGGVHGRFTALINPQVPIPPSASAVHHIVDQDVIGCPTLGSVMKLIDADVYVAHGADYDSVALGLTDKQWICTHRLAKHVWPEIENHSNQEIRYTLRLDVDLPKDTAAHRAAADAAVTAAIFEAALPLALQKWPEIQTVADLIDRIMAPALLLKLPFKSASGQLFEAASTDHLEWIVRTGAGGLDCVFTAEHWLDQRYRTNRDNFQLNGDEEE